MAAITQNSGGKKSSRRISTHIDMTPMVDLGFLLITFFVLVTSFTKPTAMDLTIPANDCAPPPEIPESKVLQIILGKNDKLYYFRGITNPEIDSIDFSNSASVRNVFDAVGEKIKNQWGSDSAMIVLVKPMKNSKYKNMVDIMDEIAIRKVKSYALVEFKTEDSLMVFAPPKSSSKGVLRDPKGRTY